MFQKLKRHQKDSELLPSVGLVRFCFKQEQVLALLQLDIRAVG